MALGESVITREGSAPPEFVFASPKHHGVVALYLMSVNIKPDK